MKSRAVDAYIAKSPAFARPILEHLRSLMHKGIVAGMAAFKQHAAFGFWSKRLLEEVLGKDAEKLSPKNAESGMGGRKFLSLSELPPDALLIRAIKAAVALNEEGVRPTRELRKKPPVKPPPYLVAALRKNAMAKKTFEGFTPSQQREYVEWLTDAKQEATRARRLATTIEWLAEGKQRNWKYQNC